jgi:hypothetical protein
MAWNRDTTLGTVSYDIVANDKTSAGTQAASISVKGLTDNFFFLFNQITQTFKTLENAGRQVYAFAQDVVDLNTQFSRLHQTTTLSYRELEQWKHVALMADVDFNTLARTVGMFQMRVQDTEKGTSKAGAAIKSLGIEMKNTDGSARPMNDIMLDVFGTLGSMEPTVKRNAIAAEIFGMRWQQIAPLMSKTREEIQEYLNLAPNLMSDVDRERAQEFEVQMKLINEKFEIMRYRVGEELMPAFKEWSDVLEPLFAQDGVVAKGISFISDRLTDVAMMMQWYSSMWTRVAADSEGNAEKMTEAHRKEAHEYRMMLVARQQGYDAMVKEDRMYHGLPEKIDRTTAAMKDLADDEITADLAKEAKAARDLVDAIADLNNKLAESPANIESAAISLEEADTKLKQLSEMARETTEFGGPGMEYEKREHPDEIDPVTGIKWSDHQYYLQFLKDLRKAKNDDEAAANKLNALKHDQFDATRKLNDLVQESTQKLLVADQEQVASAEAKVEKLATLETDQYTTMAELARQAYQAILDYAADTIDWVGMHPVEQQIITVTNGTPDYVPDPYTPVDRLTLKKAIIGTVTAAPETEGGGGGGTGGKIVSGQPASHAGTAGSITVNVNQTNASVSDITASVVKGGQLLARNVTATGMGI